MSAGDGSAAGDTTYNFFPYNEYHRILVFRVFSAVPGLLSLIRGSFSKPRLSDPGKARDVHQITFQLTGELPYFSAGTKRADVPCSYCYSFFWQSDGCFRSSSTLTAPHLKVLQWGARSLWIRASTDRACCFFAVFLS